MSQQFAEEKLAVKPVTAETDPVFGASPAAGILAGDIVNWDTAFGWGDHAGLYDPLGAAAAVVSNDAYGAGWDGVDDIAPSKNAVYDKIETLSGSAHDAVTLDVDADTLLSLSTQELGLDTQSPNMVFAGPETPGGMGANATLLHFDGVDGSSTFTDENAAHTWTRSGDAQIDTAEKRFGTGSGMFDGTGDYVTANAHADFAMGTGAFTFQCFLNMNASIVDYGRIFETEQYNVAGGWLICVDNFINNRITFQRSKAGGGGTAIASDAAFPKGSWTHFAIVRDLTGTVKMYVGGAVQVETIAGDTTDYSSTTARIGSTLGAASNYYMGYIDELMLSPGEVLYTGSFTPPSAPFGGSTPAAPTFRLLVAADIPGSLQLLWDTVWADPVHSHANNGEGGTLTWANIFSVAAAGTHAHSSTTTGGTLDWDNCWADAVHSHASNAEGGTLDWNTCWTDAVHSHQSAAEGGTLSIVSGPNLITNSGFGVWSNSTLENVGDQISVTAIASGVCTTTDTEGLIVGKLVKFGAGGSTENKVYEVTAVTTNTNFTIHDTSITDATDVTCYEVTPGCVAADALGPDGFGKSSTVDVWREHTGSNTKVGSFYACKVYKASGTWSYELYFPSSQITAERLIPRVAGRSIVIGAWVKCGTAGKARLYIRDGVSSNATSSANVGTGYEWLECTLAVNAIPTTFHCGLHLDASAAAITAYVSQARLSFGTYLGSGNYEPIPNEVVWCEDNFSIYDAAAASTSITYNVEAETNGKVPKDAVAFYISVMARGATKGDYLAFRNAATMSWSLRMCATVNAADFSSDGVVLATSVGDIYMENNNAAEWSNINIYFTGIQVC